MRTESGPAEERPVTAFVAGAVIGTLGGLIGLGGAEFRLPLLIGLFHFRALEAVILNKAMSLVVVATALPFRARSVPFDLLTSHWTIVANLLAGSLLGAWFGAGYATRLKSSSLYRTIAALLVGIALVLLFGHDAGEQGDPLLTGTAQILASSRAFSSGLSPRFSASPVASCSFRRSFSCSAPI